MCVPSPSLVPIELRIGQQIPLNWSYRQLWAAMCMLSSKLGTSCTAVNALTTEKSL